MAGRYRQRQWSKQSVAEAVAVETDSYLDELSMSMGRELVVRTNLMESRSGLLPRSKAAYHRWDMRIRYLENYLAAADAEMDRREIWPEYL